MFSKLSNLLKNFSYVVLYLDLCYMQSEPSIHVIKDI